MKAAHLPPFGFLRQASAALLAGFALGNSMAQEEESVILYSRASRGAVVPSRSQPLDESKAHKSLDVKALSPLADQLGKLGIFSGFYEFDEGVEDKVVGVKNRREVSYANQAYFQSEYHVNPDLRRENGFVGLWTSIPLRSPGESSAEEVERMRTARAATPGAAAGVGPIAEVSAPLPSAPSPWKGLSQLFKPKPKTGLIPTGGAQPAPGVGQGLAAAAAPVFVQAVAAGHEPGLETELAGVAAASAGEQTPAVAPSIGQAQADRGAQTQAPSSMQVPPPAQAAGPVVASTAPAEPVTPRKRILGLIPYSPTAPAGAAGEEKRARWAEQIFGKPSPPPRRAPSRPGSWFHR